MLRRRDVSRRYIVAVNGRNSGSPDARGTFVDPNRRVDDWDFGLDGLHINRRGARYLEQLYSRVSGIGGGRQKMRSE